MVLLIALELTSNAVCATLCSLMPPSKDEVGHCDRVEVMDVGDVRVTAFTQSSEASPVSTVVIRGATPNVMDDMERAVDDGVNVFKALTKDPRMLPGAGATEIELASRLERHGQAQTGLEQCVAPLSPVCCL